MTRMKLSIAVLLFVLTLGAGPAIAALDSVSGFDPTLANPAAGMFDQTDVVPVLAPVTPPLVLADVPQNILVSLATGFPIWYRDTGTGLKLELCLEQNGFCLLEAPAAAPISFPLNFGPEAFWWNTETSALFQTSEQEAIPNQALLVMALEAAFANEIPLVGDQVAFSRLRLRIDVPVPGDVTVTHPFGQASYQIGTLEHPVGRRAINETQDLGNFLLPGPAGDFTAALLDGPAPAEVVPGLPAVVPRVDDLGPDLSIGPFLSWSNFVAPPTIPNPVPFPLIDAAGNRYLGFPGLGVAGIFNESTIVGSPLATNSFQVTFTPNLSTPAGFVFDPADGDGDGSPNSITATNFLTSGKLYNDGPNTAPVARNDFAATSAGTPAVIDVIGNDEDLRLVGADPFDTADVGNVNVHGLHPQALSLDPTGGFLIQTNSANNSFLIRQTTLATGETVFLFSPAEGFSGIDSFQYVVQDTGGLVSTPAQVFVTVDDLALKPATLRPKLMKWGIAGTGLPGLSTLDAAGNEVFLTSLSGVWNSPMKAESTGSGGATVTVLRDLQGSVTDLNFTLDIDNLSGVTAAHIHAAPDAGSPGTLAPIAVTLFDADGDIATIGAEANPVSIDAPLSANPGNRFPAVDPRNGLTITDVDDPLNGPLPDLDAVVQAIVDGRAYIQVHTVANPPGEIRGQLGRNLVAAHGGADLNGTVLGVTEVRPDGTWSLPAKTTVSPAGISTITLRSSAGGVLLDQPLKLR